MAAPKVKVRVMYSTKKAKVKTFASAIAEAFKCLCNEVPGDFPCDKERVVFIGMTIKDAPEDKLRLFCREMTKARAQNVALMIDGDDTYPLKHAREMVDLVLNKHADMVVGDRLSSTYFEENPASGRVMEKSGMKKIEYTDTIEYRGKVHKCLYYVANR